MGGAVSSGRDNDELVDNLIDADYIISKQTERVFRAVDRGDYYLSEHRSAAYKDGAWKHGHLHLSAPCIYTKVVEALELKPHHSFLNLGSGTGYLSTMIGLIVGHKGMNHGVEYYADVIEYANSRLDAFMKESSSINAFDFCPPRFVQGNCLRLAPCERLYDRVYCGAGCPEESYNYIKNLIKIGGIAVIPCDDRLLKVRRTDNDQWSEDCILSVAFASLLEPTASDSIIELPTIDVRSLKSLCRIMLRNTLRSDIHKELPEPSMKRKAVKKTKKVQNVLEDTGIRWFQIFRDHNPANDDSSSSDDDGHDKPTVQSQSKSSSADQGAGSSCDKTSSTEVQGTSSSSSNLTPLQSSDVDIPDSFVQCKDDATPSTSGAVAECSSASNEDQQLACASNQSAMSLGNTDSPKRKHQSSENSAEESDDSQDGMKRSSTGCCGCSKGFMSRRKRKNDTHTQTDHEMVPASNNAAMQAIDSISSDSEEDPPMEDEHERFVRRREALRSLIQVFDDRREPVYTEEETEDMERRRETIQLYHSQFSTLLRDRVNSLPIPQSLKDYLLYFRNCSQ